jgi:hypothetical protein
VLLGLLGMGDVEGSFGAKAINTTSELEDAAARIRREMAAEAGFAVPSPKDAATRRAADELPAHLMAEPGTAEAAMAAFISSGGEPEPEPQPDPSEDKLPLVALSADGTVYQHELSFFESE